MEYIISAYGDTWLFVSIELKIWGLYIFLYVLSVAKNLNFCWFHCRTRRAFIFSVHVYFFEAWPFHWHQSLCTGDFHIDLGFTLENLYVSRSFGSIKLQILISFPKNSGEQTVTVMSICPSSYCLNLLFIRNLCCWQQMFIEKRACGPRSLKVILESSSSEHI
jgi:hypothetical protein